MLAFVAEVASEALAQAGGVVADAATRAVAAFLVAVAEEDVWAGGALLQRAIGAAEAKVAHAADRLHRVPRGVVSLVRLHRELLLSVADTPAAAVVRAYCALACDTFIVLKTSTLSSFSVAEAFV